MYKVLRSFTDVSTSVLKNWNSTHIFLSLSENMLSGYDDVIEILLEAWWDFGIMTKLVSKCTNKK